MSVRLMAVAFDAHDPSVPAAFWADMLDRPIIADAHGAFLPGTGAQLGLRFDATEAEELSRPNRVHLHLTSTDIDDQRAIVAKALRLGGRVIREQPDSEVVMADSGRNEFCVIEPGNDFLADCGFLAEVTCEGPREAGLFWSEALEWPLVWDRGDQTAVQSPHGGTKVSWDVRPEPSHYGTRRQRLVLATADPGDATARLAALGAAQTGADGDRILMADPGGGEFWIIPA